MKHWKSLRTYLVPLLAICAMFATWAPPAKATNQVSYVGTAGSYTGDCIDACCNIANGCQFWNNYAYDRWFSGFTCSGSLVGAGGPCTQVFRGCRDIEIHQDPHCLGGIDYHEYTNQAMCKGGTNPFS